MLKEWITRLRSHVVNKNIKRIKGYSIMVFTIASLMGCSPNKTQQVIPLTDVESRIYKTLENEDEFYAVQNIEEFNENELRQVFRKFVNLEIPEKNLRKKIVVNENGAVILHFSPVQDGVEINNSYVLQFHDGVLAGLATNPSSFKIPDSFDVNQIIKFDKQEKLKTDLLKRYKGDKIMVTDESLYFDCHEYGKIIYTVKVEIDTTEYAFAEVYVFDAYSGALLNN